MSEREGSCRLPIARRVVANEEIVGTNLAVSRGDNRDHLRRARGTAATGPAVNSLTGNANSLRKAGDRLGVVLEEISEFHTQEYGTEPVTRQAPLSPFRCVGKRNQIGYKSGMTWLKHFLTTKKVSAIKLAEAAGTTRQTISRLSKGTMEMTPTWAEKLSPHLGISPANLLSGPNTGVKLVVQEVPVRGEAAAGRWAEADDLDQGRYKPVSAVLGEYAADIQFAFRIVGPSMDQKRIFDGDFVICVPYWEARARAVDGDIVIVEQRRGQLTERTCKELIVTNGGYELWPRSSHPRWQEPIVIPRANDPHSTDGTEIEIIGLVIGIFVDMRKRP